MLITWTCRLCQPPEPKSIPKFDGNGVKLFPFRRNLFRMSFTMKSYWYILGALLLICGCDLVQEEQENLVGDISIINPNNQEDKGYKLVIYEHDFNKNIIEDYVIEVEGNDTLLLGHGVTKSTCDETYYKINHNRGKEPLRVIGIDKRSYNVLKESDYKYSFSTNVPDCK